MQRLRYWYIRFLLNASVRNIRKAREHVMYGHINVLNTCIDDLMSVISRYYNA